jgi:hypothetical protein
VVGEQVGQSLLFSRGQSLGGHQHGYSVADGLSDQSFAAGLPRDPERHRAHLPPVDPVVVAAVPGRTERNHLAGQAPPPRRRCRDAAAVHALISEVPASDVPGRRGRAEVPVLWGTPSFIGKSTEAITEIRL